MGVVCSIHMKRRTPGHILEPRHKSELGKGEDEVHKSIRAGKARKRVKQNGRKGKDVDRGHIFG